MCGCIYCVCVPCCCVPEDHHCPSPSVITAPPPLSSLPLPLCQVYCCVGALAVANALHHVDADQLGWWLCERQLPSGGLNGRDTHKCTQAFTHIHTCMHTHTHKYTRADTHTHRLRKSHTVRSALCAGRPEKLPDVCYSWWVLASLQIIGRIHWISKVCALTQVCHCTCKHTIQYVHLYGSWRHTRKLFTHSLSCCGTVRGLHVKLLTIIS